MKKRAFTLNDMQLSNYSDVGSTISFDLGNGTQFQIFTMDWGYGCYWKVVKPYKVRGGYTRDTVIEEGRGSFGSREEALEDFLNKHSEYRTAMQKRAHNVQVGDIFENTYGYEASITHFWQVTRVSEKSVWVRQIKKKCISKGDYWSYGEDVLPIPDAFVGEEYRKKLRISPYRGTPCFTVNSYSDAYLWDGKPINNYNWH